MEAQELARQRLSADERETLAATVSELAQRQMLDDTAYALQVITATDPTATVVATDATRNASSRTSCTWVWRRHQLEARCSASCCIRISTLHDP